MIKIDFKYDMKAREFSLTVNGHAGQAEIGQDIVCASASILAYTLAQVILKKHLIGFLEDAPSIILGGGDATVSCKAREGCECDIGECFSVIETGYMLLAHNYPQFVELITDGEAE